MVTRLVYQQRLGHLVGINREAVTTLGSISPELRTESIRRQTLLPLPAVPTQCSRQITVYTRPLRAPDQEERPLSDKKSDNRQSVHFGTGWFQRSNQRIGNDFRLFGGGTLLAVIAALASSYIYCQNFGEGNEFCKKFDEKLGIKKK
jgi:hypothetical protein